MPAMAIRIVPQPASVPISHPLVDGRKVSSGASMIVSLREVSRLAWTRAVRNRLRADVSADGLEPGAERLRPAPFEVEDQMDRIARGDAPVDIVDHQMPAAGREVQDLAVAYGEPGDRPHRGHVPGHHALVHLDPACL